jgi:hypothetical protein
MEQEINRINEQEKRKQNEEMLKSQLKQKRLEERIMAAERLKSINRNRLNSTNQLLLDQLQNGIGQNLNDNVDNNFLS